jgi:hypothetical protein
MRTGRLLFTISYSLMKAKMSASQHWISIVYFRPICDICQLTGINFRSVVRLRAANMTAFEEFGVLPEIGKVTLVHFA